MQGCFQIIIGTGNNKANNHQADVVTPIFALGQMKTPW